MTKAIKKKGVCIICHEEKKGYPIEEDYVINFIKDVKKFFKAYKGNQLVVCEDCIEDYKMKRAKFEKNLLIYGGAGILLGLLLIILNLSLANVVLAALFAIMMIILAHFNYMPKVKYDDKK